MKLRDFLVEPMSSFSIPTTCRRGAKKAACTCLLFFAIFLRPVLMWSVSTLYQSRTNQEPFVEPVLQIGPFVYAAQMLKTQIQDPQCNVDVYCPSGDRLQSTPNPLLALLSLSYYRMPYLTLSCRNVDVSLLPYLVLRLLAEMSICRSCSYLTLPYLTLPHLLLKCRRVDDREAA